MMNIGRTWKDYRLDNLVYSQPSARAYVMW